MLTHRPPAAGGPSPSPRGLTSGSTDPECFVPEDNEQCRTVSGCIGWVPDICGDTFRPSDRIMSRLHGGERWLDSAECARREPTRCGPNTWGCIGWEGAFN